MAQRRTPPRWTCPLCERSVPGDVSTCYCGTRRAAVEAHAERERRKAPGLPSLVFLAQIMGVGVLMYLAFQWYEGRQAPRTVTPTPAPASTPAPAGPSATPATGRFDAAAPVALPTPLTPSPQAGPSEPVIFASATPPPSARPARDPLDVEREAAELRLAATFARLQGEIDAVAEATRRFESVCLSARAERGSCERLLAEMSAAAERLDRSLEGADEDARRSWVAPGIVRDLRQRHGLDEAAVSGLAETLQRLTRQYRSGS